ncbi:MAG: hypothetical protein N2448_01930 [Caloramator sp.]|nr:hypothetical protein [Caloramator sp.]
MHLVVFADGLNKLNSTDYIIVQKTFVEHKFQSLPYSIEWDGITVGSVTLLINYNKYETWSIDKYGNKIELISENRLITNADYTNLK